MAGKTRIFLIEDYILLRTALKRALNDEPSLEVVGEAAKEEMALKLIKESKPNVIVMSAHMIETNVLDIIPKLIRWHPEIRIIVMTSQQNDPLLSRFLKIGAMGILTRDISLEDAIHAIQLVNRGQRYISPTASNQIAFERLNGSDQSLLETLSTRELQVMMLVIQGLNTATIANRLATAAKTVCSYRYRIYNKLNIKSDVELIRLALQYKLLD